MTTLQALALLPVAFMTGMIASPFVMKCIPVKPSNK